MVWHQKHFNKYKNRKKHTSTCWEDTQKKIDLKIEVNVFYMQQSCFLSLLIHFPHQQTPVNDQLLWLRIPEVFIFSCCQPKEPRPLPHINRGNIKASAATWLRTRIKIKLYFTLNIPHRRPVFWQFFSFRQVLHFALTAIHRASSYTAWCSVTSAFVYQCVMI